MRLSAEDRRSQILSVATELFASHGFEGATTREIAEKAGVTEAIIFRHFPRKEDLYWAVITDTCSSPDALEQLAELLESARPEIEIFTEIARDRIERNLRNPAKSRLLLFSALENHRLSELFFRTFISSHHELLARYVERQVKKGRFRPVDPMLAARSFLGTLFQFFMVQELFGAKRFQPYETDEVAREMATMWLAGVLADPAELHAQEGAAKRKGAAAANGTEGHGVRRHAAVHLNGNGTRKTNGRR